MNVNVLFCGTGWRQIVDVIRPRLPEGASIRARILDRPLAPQVRDAHVLLPSNAGLDAALLAEAPDVVLIQQPAVGVDGIDLDAARARGIPVCNAPNTNSDSVAEATLFLLLALARRLPSAQRAFAEARVGEPAGIELRGKTLGLVGFGRSGTRVAALAKAVGMRVLYVRSTSPKAQRDELFAESDFVSLHCPLTEETRGLMDEAAFARMKRGAFLVNCARGPIVDRAALESALESGRLGGFAVDTFWKEPWDPADPLFGREDVIALPHVAGSTEEAFGGTADIVAENVRRILRGEELLHRVA